MIFRKKTAPAPVVEETPEPDADASVLELLQRLERAGVQLLVTPGGQEAFTSTVVGLGRDAFFVDTLSPPEGDRRMRPGTRVEVETLFQGMTYSFSTSVLAKVQFVDELPAFKLAFPDAIPAERRRKSPRIDTRGDASVSFLNPFGCDAPVVNVSEGGLAFEYDAGLGRLRPGTVLRDVLVELGPLPVFRAQGRVVGNLVAELGGLSLPRRYRASLAFQGLSVQDLSVIRKYLETLKGFHASA